MCEVDVHPKSFNHFFIIIYNFFILKMKVFEYLLYVKTCPHMISFSLC